MAFSLILFFGVPDDMTSHMIWITMSLIWMPWLCQLHHNEVLLWARQEEVPPSHQILSNVAFMKLLDLVEMCKKASEVVSETMEQVSANLEPSPQSWSIYKNLEKVLEALGMDQNTVDTCITGVAPQSADVQYMHASLRMKSKRKAT